MRHLSNANRQQALTTLLSKLALPTSVAHPRPATMLLLLLFVCPFSAFLSLYPLPPPPTNKTPPFLSWRSPGCVLLVNVFLKASKEDTGGVEGSVVPRSESCNTGSLTVHYTFVRGDIIRDSSAVGACSG